MADGPRAIGIVRVSEVKGRSGDGFSSPKDQRRMIEQECERHGFRLIEVVDELDVSGGKPLAQRPLGKVIERLERGELGEGAAIVFAYRDRADRSVEEGSAAIRRIEAAGGILVAGGLPLSHKTADQWVMATMGSVMSEWVRRVVKEKAADGQRSAVERGAILWSRVPLGYVKLSDATLEPDPTTAPVVQKAFEMRLSGASIMDVRNMLQDHGVKRSHRGAQEMLANRVYLGEISFKIDGKQETNPAAHDPIVERELFERVQRMKVPRGPRVSSDRLLSGLKVLRCGSCGSSLGTMKLPKQNDYPIYRCPSTAVCDRHVTISAVIAERVVSEAVRRALRDEKGRASAAEGAQEARSALERAQADLDVAVRGFAAAGLTSEPSAIEELAKLRQARDDAQLGVDQIGPDAALTINAAIDWDRLSLEGRRELIRAVVERVEIAPAGRGAERVKVHLFI